MIAAYDLFFLRLFHGMANGFFTFFAKLISLLGEKGILFFLAALVMMCFSRTRKLGICLFGAVACGALITNIILKDTVARIRPFEAIDQVRSWWEAVGAPQEDGFSFPSGHATAAAAGCTAICLMKGKKWITPSVIWVLLMMCSRNYLMVHYPTDVLAGAVIGVASGFIAFYITQFIYRILHSNQKQKWADFILTWNAPVDVAALQAKAASLLPLDRLHLPKLPALSRKSGDDEEEYEDDEDDAEEEETEEHLPVKRQPKPSKSSAFAKATYVGKHEKH